MVISEEPYTQINMAPKEKKAITMQCEKCQQVITVLEEVAYDRKGLCSICYYEQGTRGVISNV